MGPSIKTSANLHDFWHLPPFRRQFFTTIRRQIWQIFDPSPPTKCRRLKWMVPMNFHNELKFYRKEHLCLLSHENWKAPSKIISLYCEIIYTVCKMNDFERLNWVIFSYLGWVVGYNMIFKVKIILVCTF